MQLRKLIILSVLVLSIGLIIGCQDRNKTVPKETQQPVTDAGVKQSLPVTNNNQVPEPPQGSANNQNQLVNMGEYPSPGRDARIVMMGQYDQNDGSLHVEFYSGQPDNKPIYRTNLGKDWNKPVVWVNDNQVLLYNTWLYDLASSKGIDLKPPGAESIWASALNSENALVAMTGKTHSPMQIAVWVVNLGTKKVTEVVRYAPNPGWTQSPGFHLSWGPDNNLYFDADYKGSPAIFRLDPEAVKPEVLLTDAWAPAVSPDGQHLAYLASKGYAFDDSSRIKIRVMESGNEVDTGQGSGYMYWSPFGNHLAIFGSNSISYFQVATHEGESTSLVRKLTDYPGQLRFIEFLDNSHILVQETTTPPEVLEATKSFVFGPDAEGVKVWEAARAYMEAKGRTVGLSHSDVVLAVGHIFANRAVVAYGDAGSEFYADLLLENNSGTWQVVGDQDSYFSYYYDFADQAIEALAKQENLDFGWEPGKMQVGVKNGGQDNLTLIVGKYGWPWSVEYDMVNKNGNWEMEQKRELK